MRPRKTILCVDNSEQILSIRKFMLETRGYKVITCQNANDALAVLSAALPGSIDLLLTDLLMPGMDGNELARRSKQLQPSLPTLLISGTVNGQERGLAADAFLPKASCNPTELLERIRILVARKRGPKKHVAAAPAPALPVPVALAS